MENLLAAGRLKLFLGNWNKLTSNLYILKRIQGYQRPLLSELIQFTSPSEIQKKQEDQEIKKCCKRKQ